jgi:tryptophan-rich sensory protein
MGFTRRDLTAFLWCYVPVFTVQMIAARVTMDGMGPWYDELQKAPWNPPAYLFGPVWTLLYLLMAVSAWLLYQSPAEDEEKMLPTALFFIQLSVNGLWSILFFGLQWIGWAVFDLALLVVLVGACAWAFYRVRPLAGWLFLPYFLWVSYALSLNVMIFLLNR